MDLLEEIRKIIEENKRLKKELSEKNEWIRCLEEDNERLQKQLTPETKVPGVSNSFKILSGGSTVGTKRKGRNPERLYVQDAPSHIMRAVVVNNF